MEYGLFIVTLQGISPAASLYMVHLAAHVSKGGKSLILPGSGKDTAKTRGVLFITRIMINARGI